MFIVNVEQYCQTKKTPEITFILFICYVCKFWRGEKKIKKLLNILKFKSLYKVIKSKFTTSYNKTL